MKKIYLIFSLVIAVSGTIAQHRVRLSDINGNASSNPGQKLTLWYSQPAKDWNEALPVGNGRLGAMIFGEPKEELIQLNEQTLWTGGPVDLNPNPNAFRYLQPVRDALFADSIGTAVKLLQNIQGPNTETYQPLGNLVLKQQFTGEPVSYKRSLDIANAIATTSFTAGGVAFTREIFSSAPAQVIIIRLTAGKARQLNVAVGVNHELQFGRMFAANDELVLKGKARITNDERRNTKPLVYADSAGCDGMRFQFRVKALHTDGTITHADSMMAINGATEIVLFISAATSFNGYDKCPDREGKNEDSLAVQYLQKALKKSYVSLRAEHIADYQHFFNRVALTITGKDESDKPTDERLAAYKASGNDVNLESLYFQFGRYLLISSSRPGGMPANLQGIWNKEIRPPWRSNYTTNINVQMNYWPAEVCNLSELVTPLINHTKRWAVNGAATAKNYYHMQGWALHHNSDIWAQTNPVGEGTGDPKWANWSLGSPWVSQHLYEHYRFSKDKDYLRKTAYPLMKGAAQFCLDWLVEKNGVLVTAPSTSPENVYMHPAGFKGTVTIASAMDMEIIWDCFTNVIEAAIELGIDKDFTALLQQKRAMLSPLKIGKKGNLVEWFGDWEDEDPQHRHVSHLFALHPGREISPLLDTAFAAACRKTLEIRGDGGTGWSKAWKINFWARLLDGNHAYKMYQELLKTSTLINLFDTHPPFQIDGNFGATAGIAEMLLQSHLKDIYLLPALPDAWQNGHVKGLKARGNFEIEMQWEKGRLNKAFIKAVKGGTCTIRTNNKVIIKGVQALSKATAVIQGTQYITTFSTVAGKVYELSTN